MVCAPGLDITLTRRPPTIRKLTMSIPSWLRSWKSRPLSRLGKAAAGGRLWYSQEVGISPPLIGEMDVNGNVVQEFHLPQGDDVGDLVANPDGNSIWFTEYYNSEVGRLNISDGSIQYYAFPMPCTN